LWSLYFIGNSEGSTSSAGTLSETPVLPLQPHRARTADRATADNTHFIFLARLWRPLRVPGDSETGDILTLMGSLEEATRGSAVRLTHEPAAATYDPMLASPCAFRVVLGRFDVVILVVAVLTPLPHVAVHVVESPGIDRVAADPGRPPQVRPFL